MGVGASGTGSAQIELSAATVKVSITQIELSHPSLSIGVFGSLHQRVYIPAEKHDWLPAFAVVFYVGRSKSMVGCTMRVYATSSEQPNTPYTST